MKILIYGMGAIGSHLAYCLYKNKAKITGVCRGKHYLHIKKRGLRIKIYENKTKLKENVIKENKNFLIYNNLNFKNKKFDIIFITVKIHQITDNMFKEISKFCGPNTAIVPPCTDIPSWIYPKINSIKYNKKNLTFLKYFFLENIIAITMWVSGRLIKPGVVHIRHIQRGYPIMNIKNKMKKKTIYLRKCLKKYCKSPIVKNFTSEAIIKVTNSFAFNLVALNTNYENFEINLSINAKKKILEILKETDKIIIKLGLKVPQTPESRIKQTLSSNVHIMSMLEDFRNGKKIEINNQWDSIKNLSTALGIKLVHSNKLYDKVKRKILTI